MKMKAAIAALCLAAPLAGFSQTVSYDLTQTNVDDFGAGPYGTVTLTQSGADVNVSVSLASAFNFVDTGAHEILSFDVLNVATADVSNITFANGLGDVFGVEANVTNSPFGSSRSRL